jgi:hypothetical protein
MGFAAPASLSPEIQLDFAAATVRIVFNPRSKI